MILNLTFHMRNYVCKFLWVCALTQSIMWVKEAAKNGEINSLTDTVDVSQHRMNIACFIISKSDNFISCYTKLF